MHVDVRVLGGFEVAVDGRRVPAGSWRRRHAAALVKLLALSPGHRVHREQVIDALWPDLLVEEAAPRLHKATHFARTAMGARDAIALSGDAIVLFPGADVVVDVDRFDAEAEAARDDRGGDHARAAVDCYGGDLLPDDLYERWTETPRVQRRLRYLELLRELGRWEDVLAADPADEEAHLHLVRDRVRRGDRGGALRQLDWMETALREAFDADPSDAARALRDEVLAMSADASTDEVQPAPGAVPIPVPVTPTIGRECDVERVVALLGRSRIVTLLGPGGVGKTRLALEVALAFTDGTGIEGCFVDLTKVRDASLVVGLIVRELGIHVESDADARQLLEGAVRGRSLLLVLDNFEHVIDAAGIVSEIAQWSPGVRILTTTRTRLRVAGEHVHDVAALSVDADTATGVGDAVALFEQAAAAVDPSFRLDASLSDVVRICRTVDGLPLAIELAAGHVRTLPPALLLARLGTRLGSTSGASRDAPARQQTVPAMIDWSLQLLGEPERRLFSRLGVFAGAVPLEAIEHVCADDGLDVVEALIRLVEQSLVRRVPGRTGDPRYVMLELIRERARDLLRGEDARLAADRHAEYFATFLEDVDERRWTDASDCWIDLVTESLAETRSAHAHAHAHGDFRQCARITASLGTYWHREGYHAEGRQWAADALAHVADLDERLAARLHLAAGFVEWPRSTHAARQQWDHSIDAFRRLGDDRHLAYTLALSSGTYIGDATAYDAAMRLCDESIDLARRVGERPLIAQAVNIKGELARVQGDDELALAAYQDGQQLAEAAGDDAHVSVFLANLSYLADHRGEYDEARRLGCEALRLCWSQGRRMMAAWTVSELAGPELGLARPERGALFIGAADEALRALGANRHPGDHSEHERVVSGIRNVLGDEAFEQLRAEGSRIPLDEVVRMALSDADGPASPAEC